MDRQLSLAKCGWILILANVRCFWQAIALIGLTAGAVSAQEPRAGGEEQDAQDLELKIKWEPLKVGRSHFARSLGMLDAERDDYAGNLAGVAVSQIRERKGEASSVALARRMVALSLHLSPRNRKALVVNIQLGRGVVPRPPESDYRPQTMARLLMKRAEMLKKQDGKANLELAGYMLDVALGLDPNNEDVIYMSELHRLDHGEVDWSPLTGDKE